MYLLFKPSFGSSKIRTGNLEELVNSGSMENFVNYWSGQYQYHLERKYEKNIGKPLTKKSIQHLYEWKNGRKLSKKKQSSVDQNYPPVFNGSLENRYLNYTKSGGAIWNIFYCHCQNPNKWPIYDQHTHRAMRFIQTGKIEEIAKPHEKKKIYESYKEYRGFLKSLEIDDKDRKLDKALFCFGKRLKDMDFRLGDLNKSFGNDIFSTKGFVKALFMFFWLMIKK